MGTWIARFPIGAPRQKGLPPVPGVLRLGRQCLSLGSLVGTAVLGALMSAKISSTLPASWHAAHLPALSAAQLAQVKSAVSVGAAPLTQSTPARAAGVITQISHDTFVAGMHNAFLVAAVVTLAGALIALIAKRGNGDPAAHAGI
jgi:hypothetical protein